MTLKKVYTDVLIVGAGPAGLMMATWLAKCGIDFRIIEKRNTKILNGQADGLQSRTMEILESFGLADRVKRESNITPIIHVWNPDEKGKLHRSGELLSPTCSRFDRQTLHQGRIERFFIDEIANCGGSAVERGVLPIKLNIDESLVDDANAYPITVQIRHLSEEEATPKQVGTAVNGQSIEDGIFRSNLADDDTEELLTSSELKGKAGQEEVIRAKYLLGSDGGHSWTRKQLGFKMEGDSTDYIWGVLDIVPITNFPDIRMGVVMHSANAGSVLQIPRENHLVRLYVQPTTTDMIGDGNGGGARFDKSRITPESILEAAQRIYAPYTMNYRILDWWTAYQVGQRVADSFSAFDRVFLAGDAVHTHSPKAGQGMNTSIQDTFNLGWKVASVIRGLSDRSILTTYQAERRGIAETLINYDRKYAKLFSGRPAKDLEDQEGVSMEEFQEIMAKNLMFVAGLAVDYGASVLVAKEERAEDQNDAADRPSSTKPRITSDQSLAIGMSVGKRMPSSTILNQAAATPTHLEQLLQSNGKWRVVFFPGDIHNPHQRQKLDAIGATLNDKCSFRNRYTPPSAAFDAVFEILAVHSSPRTETTIFDFPEAFRRFDEMYGYDYSKIYVDEEHYRDSPGGYPRVYEALGISDEGCVVIIRPDQYVSYVGPVDDVNIINRFFEGFMLAPHAEGNGEAAATNANGSAKRASS